MKIQGERELDIEEDCRKLRIANVLRLNHIHFRSEEKTNDM